MQQEVRQLTDQCGILNQENNELRNEIKQYSEKLESTDAAGRKFYMAQITAKENQILEKEKQVTAKENEILEKEKQITAKENEIVEKEKQITAERFAGMSADPWVFYVCSLVS